MKNWVRGEAVQSLLPQHVWNEKFRGRLMTFLFLDVDLSFSGDVMCFAFSSRSPGVSLALQPRKERPCLNSGAVGQVAEQTPLPQAGLRSRSVRHCMGEKKQQDPQHA